MHIDFHPTVTPVHAPTRRIPVAKLDRVNEELGRLCEERIIMPVTEPTDWLSNIMVKEKPNGKLRISIDPSQTLNKAIKRPKYTTPTIEERLPPLTKAKVFTVVDVSEAFHTIGGQMVAIVTIRCLLVFLPDQKNISGDNMSFWMD